MPRGTHENSLANLKNQGKSRKKGVPNKITAEMKEFIRRVFDSPEYRESIRKRITAGKAQEFERLWYAHALGKPVDRIELSAGLQNQVLTYLSSKDKDSDNFIEIEGEVRQIALTDPANDSAPVMLPANSDDDADNAGAELDDDDLDN